MRLLPGFRKAPKEGTTARGATPSRRISFSFSGFRREHFIFAMALLALMAIHIFLFPNVRSIQRIQIEVGTITEQEIRAPMNFEAPRPSRDLEIARRDAAERVEPAYRSVPGVEERVTGSIHEFFQRLGEAAAEDSVSPSLRIARLREVYSGLDTRHFDYLLNSRGLESLQRSIQEAAQSLMESGIVDVTPRGTYQNLSILSEESEAEERRPIDSVVLAYRVEDSLRRKLSRNLRAGQSLDAAISVAQYHLLPNLHYNDATTQSRRKAASDAVPATRQYSKNERIIGAGIRVTRDHVEVLQALERAREERALQQDATIAIRLRVGRVLILALILVGLVYSFWWKDRSILHEKNRFLLAVLLLALHLAFSAMVLRLTSWGEAALPITLLAMMATMLFGEAAGYRLATAGILLIMILPEYSSAMMVVWALSAGAAIRMVRKVRNRNQFYRALGFVASITCISIFALKIGGPEGLTGALYQCLIGFAGVTASTVLCLFLLPLLEALFGVGTDLTLLELSDLNHPLLRRMSLETPGTFHHSQVVGTLAEAGARAIGVNSLLARVGANFHDIGKMLKPRYYVENQGEGNAHDDLSPTMSAIVIASHVRDGVDLGRQWGLPRDVLAFIPQHHGSSVMHYFYHKALERDDGVAIKVDDFRYPGPKAQSREAAVVMLADAVEAASRSLRRPTASRIRELTRNIFSRKMDEGELDECGLTLRDLARIRETFIPILVGIHHQRVAYPGQREHEDRKEKESIEARSRARHGSNPVVSGG